MIIQKLLNFDDFKNAALAALILLLIVIPVIPMPAILLDYLIGINIIIAFLISTLAINTKKIGDFLSFPAVIFVFLIFSLIINVSSVRLILSDGINFKGWFILTVSSLITGSGDVERLIGGLFSIISISVVMIIITGGSAGFTKIAAKHALDILPDLKAQKKLSGNEVSPECQEEYSKIKGEQRQKAILYGTINAVCKYISSVIKLIILITIINIIGGITIDILHQDFKINRTLNIYIPLSIGSGILFMLPAFLVSISTSILSIRILNSKQND